MKRFGGLDCWPDQRNYFKPSLWALEVWWAFIQHFLILMDKWLIGKITVRLKNNEIIINFSPNHLCYSFSYPASGGSNESKKIFLRHWTCVRCVLVLRTGLRLVNFPPLMKSSSVSPTQDECSYGPTRLQVSQRKSNRAYAYSSHPSSSKTDPENTTRSGLHVRL